MAAPTVLKVQWQAQTFRVRINGDITYSSLERSVRQALPDFPLKASLKYRDEEGDACTFCEATLSDFLAVAREGNVLRLEVCDAPVLTCAEDTVKDGPEYHDIHTPPAPSEAPAAARDGRAGFLQGASACQSVASNVVHWLPHLLTAASCRTDAIDRQVRRHLVELRPTLQTLTEIVRATKGLEQCEAQISAVLDDAAPAGEALMALLQAINLLPLEERRAVVEKVLACLPHDLCAGWFEKMGATHGKAHGEDTNVFKLIVAGLQNGLGGSELQTLGSGISAAAPAQDACSGACGFARTWHPTHCCRACQKGKGHGPACDKIKMDVPVQGATEPVHTAAAARFNFAFPVHVEDGRRLTIQWGKGDAPALVAATFAQEHGIGSDELAVIEAFVAHASAVAEDSQARTDALRQEEEEEVAKAAKLQKEAATQAEAKATMEATRAAKLKEEKEKKEAAEAEAKATREAADAADLRVKEAIGAAEAATEAAKAAKLYEKEAAKVLKEAIKAAEVLKKKAARAAAMAVKLQEKEAHREAAKAAKLQEKEAAKVEAKAVKEAARAAKLQGKEAAKEAAKTAKLQESEAARIAALEDEVAATAAAKPEVACTEAYCGDGKTRIPQEVPTTEGGCGTEETSCPEEVGFTEGYHDAMEKELPREDAAEAVGEGPSPEDAAEVVGEVPSPTCDAACGFTATHSATSPDDSAEVIEPPAALEAFEEQLELLQSMGFGEHDAGVLRAILEMNGGEMARTIDALLD